MTKFRSNSWIISHIFFACKHLSLLPNSWTLVVRCCAYVVAKRHCQHVSWEAWSRCPASKLSLLLSLICIHAFSSRSIYIHIFYFTLMSSNLLSMKVASTPSFTIPNLEAYSHSHISSVTTSSDEASSNGTESPINEEIDQIHAKEQKLPVPSWLAVISQYCSWSGV